MPDLTRRDFIAAAAATVASSVAIREAIAQPTTAPTTSPAASSPDEIHWLEGVPKRHFGVTFGVPWKRGELKPGQGVVVDTEKGTPISPYFWPTAFWPDGSVKWTAHAIATYLPTSASYRLRRVVEQEIAPALPIDDREDAFELDSGVIRVRIPKRGGTLIESIKIGDKTILKNGILVAHNDTKPDHEPASDLVKRRIFLSMIDNVTIEQNGPVRTVIKIEGKHDQYFAPGQAFGGQPRQWLPFVVRLYFYAGSDVIRMMHTFVFDGDENADFVSGIGVRFDVPMSDAPHNRHVRLVGQDHGLFGEGLRTLTGLRRDPGNAAKQAQVDGKKVEDSQIGPAVANGLQYIPVWGDFTLTQSSADGFEIRKRTKEGCGWIKAGAGQRASGIGYIGGASGGVAFGQRYFWERYPSQVDIRNAHTDNATVTMWMYSPDAPAMDLRFYHDGMGQNDSYQKQQDGLNITYEDYEPGYGTPHGIARTNELYLWPVASTPSRQDLVEFSDAVRTPPMLACSPQRYIDAKVFGNLVSIPDSSTPAKKAIEDEMKFTIDAYLKEVEQRRWYGFWDHGDVMHTYDNDRHVWRYDVGGFAWDNSELSTDQWLWLTFLRSGRADVFRFAEAMLRHTGEVDVYHAGRFKYLGTRHGVQHWADSSKQIRISTAAYRRHFYFLSGGDERVGDLLREQLQANETAKKINIGRKLQPGAPVLPLPTEENPKETGGEVELGSMGYGHLLVAWLTEAERTGDKAWHEKIVRAMNTFSALPHAFWNDAWKINLDTGEVKATGAPRYTASHLTAVFGLPETCAELALTYGDQAPKFADTWADYGRLYNGPAADRMKALGTDFKDLSLRDHHSRCTAYAARLANDRALGERAWQEFLGDRPNAGNRRRWMNARHLEGPDVLIPIDEVALGTNGAAQWGLAAIENLALIGEWLKEG